MLHAIIYIYIYIYICYIPVAERCFCAGSAGAAHHHLRRPCIGCIPLYSRLPKFLKNQPDTSFIQQNLVAN